jgi:diacylglycerol kinase family enzyme
VALPQAAGLAARLFFGTLDRSPHVLRLAGGRFVIERPAAGLIHTDGETHAAGAVVEVEVRPHSLRLRVPASSPLARAIPADSFRAPLAQPS